jgi:hypothetical protein
VAFASLRERSVAFDFNVPLGVILQHDIKIYNRLIQLFYPENKNWSFFPIMTSEEHNELAGKIYHDQLLRFWALMFTHNYNFTMNKNDNYVSYKMN